MASAFTHFAVGAACALPLSASENARRVIRPAAVAVAAGLLSVAPDLDVLLMSVVPYLHFFGHRGFFHSPFFLAGLSMILAAVPFAFLRDFKLGQWLALAAVFGVAAVSHPLLDSMTDGGRGVMLLYPFSEERIFLPWRPIPVSPLGVSRFFSLRGLRILLAELPFIVGFLALGMGCRQLLMRRRAVPSPGPSPSPSPATGEGTGPPPVRKDPLPRNPDPLPQRERGPEPRP
ncbi:MAG: metal-dependent hydrolase [Thermoanaerobaculia bacterium]